VTRVAKISAVVITFNEEAKIERCLQSVGWVDEILVVDSYSTDRTVELCRRYTDKVIQLPWPGSTAKKREISDKHASHDWILALDADEVVTKELRDEIVTTFKSETAVAAFGIPRLEYLSGRFILAGGWYPQYKFILYRKSLGAWGGGPVHLKFLTSGKTDFLKGPILHDGAPSFKIFMDKFNHYSSVEANTDAVQNGRKFNLWRAFFKPLERFFGRFVLQRGYRDGIHGFFMAAVIGLNYFLREMKIYEIHYLKKHQQKWDEVYKSIAVHKDGNK
jgi:glycosyltransferase involved in cell wall biosynthesis